MFFCFLDWVVKRPFQESVHSFDFWPRDVILINQLSLSATLEIPLSIQITSRSLKLLQAPLSLDEMAGVMLECALDTARPPSASSTMCNLRYLGGAFYPGKLKKNWKKLELKCESLSKGLHLMESSFFSLFVLLAYSVVSGFSRPVWPSSHSSSGLAMNRAIGRTKCIVSRDNTKSSTSSRSWRCCRCLGSKRTRNLRNLELRKKNKDKNLSNSENKNWTVWKLMDGVSKKRHLFSQMPQLLWPTIEFAGFSLLMLPLGTD